MAAAIFDTFNIQPELIKGKGGVFEVVMDEKCIYSKKETGQFPDNEMIIISLKALIPNP